MGVIKGNNIYIYSGTSGSSPIIAGAKSCTISKKSDVMETASDTDAVNKNFIPGRTEWEISINHLVLTNNEYQGIVKVGTGFYISVVVNGVRKTGKVICTQADISGPVGGLASGSVKLKGSGALG